MAKSETIGIEFDNNDIADGKIPSILDGEFFSIVNISSSKDQSDPKKRKVKAKCTLCKQVICGQLNATTNFKVHLKVRFKFYTAFSSELCAKLSILKCFTKYCYFQVTTYLAKFFTH